MPSVEEFHKSRIAFAFIGGRLYFIKDDPRGHDSWLSDVFGIRGEQFESIPRGYVKDNRIQLYVGSDFAPVVPKEHADELVLSVAEFLATGGKFGQYTVGNGVIAGNPGETWPAVEELGCVTVNPKMRGSSK